MGNFLSAVVLLLDPLPVLMLSMVMSGESPPIVKVETTVLIVTQEQSNNFTQRLVT